jgi:hypothetical protein
MADRATNDAEVVLFRILWISGAVIAAIVSWPLLAERRLMRRGAAVRGTIIEKVSRRWQRVLIYEYRESDASGTERLCASVPVPSGLFEHARVGDEVSVYHSRWNPARSVAEAFSLYRIVPPQG